MTDTEHLHTRSKKSHAMILTHVHTQNIQNHIGTKNTLNFFLKEKS